MCTSLVSHFIPLSGVMTAKHEGLICKSNSWLCPTLTGSSSSNTNFVFSLWDSGTCWPMFIPPLQHKLSVLKVIHVSKKGRHCAFSLKIIKTRSLFYLFIWPTSGLDNVLCLILNHLECLATQQFTPSMWKFPKK